jgi:hypothetical protein
VGQPDKIGLSKVNPALPKKTLRKGWVNHKITYGPAGLPADLVKRLITAL